MSRIEKKHLAHLQKIKEIVAYAIVTVVLVPLVAFCLGLALNDVSVSIAFAVCRKWSLIILPPLLAILLFFAFFCSDYIKFKDKSIEYYRFIFSKKSNAIDYGNISECVANSGLWLHKGEYVRGRKIYLFNDGQTIREFEINYDILFNLILNLGEATVKVVGDNRRLTTISNFYNVDFSSLSEEQQKALCKHYCKAMRNNERDGTKIIK